MQPKSLSCRHTTMLLLLLLLLTPHSWWPAWRRLPGTNIIVDCFGRSCAAVGSNHTWVLTHFHADHYMGLTRSFKQGIIICTPITAALVRLKLRVPPERLLVLGLGQELTVEGERIKWPPWKARERRASM